MNNFDGQQFPDELVGGEAELDIIKEVYCLDAKYKNSTKTKSIPVPSLAGKNGKFSKPSISLFKLCTGPSVGESADNPDVVPRDPSQTDSAKGKNAFLARWNQGGGQELK